MNIPVNITFSFIAVVTILFVSIVAMFNRALKKSGVDDRGRIQKIIITCAVILLWILFISFLTTQNFLNNFSVLPPRMALILMPPLVTVIVLINNSSFRKLLDYIPQQWVVFTQALRLPVAIIFYFLFLDRIIPVQMTFSGDNLDIIVGFSAVIIGLLVMKNKINNGILTIWNIIGLIFLAAIPVMALLAAPYPFRLIHERETNTMIAYFPFVLMPGFVIPGLFAMHVFSLRNSLKKQILLLRSLNDLWFRIIGIPLITILVTVILHTHVEFFSGDFIFFFFISLAYTISLWYGDRLIISEVRSRFPNYDQTLTRNLVQTFFVTAFTVIAVTILDRFMVIYVFHECPTLNGIPEDVILGLVISFLMLIIYESVYFFQKWRDNIFEAEELKRMQMQNKLDSLKSQVNPHFLFNSLNSLSLLIREDKKKSIAYVDEMSHVYRYILQSNENELSTVEKEIQFLKSLMFLQGIRFDDHVKTEVIIDEKFLKHRIPSLTLQALTDNAIKYNIASAQKPLLIKLFVNEKQELVVSNNLQKKAHLIAVNGYGLANIRRRYEIHGVSGMHFGEDNINFKVFLPLINPQD